MHCFFKFIVLCALVWECHAASDLHSPKTPFSPTLPSVLPLSSEFRSLSNTPPVESVTKVNQGTQTDSIPAMPSQESKRHHEIDVEEAFLNPHTITHKCLNCQKNVHFCHQQKQLKTSLDYLYWSSFSAGVFALTASVFQSTSENPRPTSLLLGCGLIFVSGLSKLATHFFSSFFFSEDDSYSLKQKPKDG